MKIYVKFDLDEYVWEKVVNESREKVHVEVEDFRGKFFVSCESEHFFSNAVSRFDGLIEFEEISEKKFISLFRKESQ